MAGKLRQLRGQSALTLSRSLWVSFLTRLPHSHCEYNSFYVYDENAAAPVVASSCDEKAEHTAKHFAPLIQLYSITVQRHDANNLIQVFLSAFLDSRVGDFSMNPAKLVLLQGGECKTSSTSRPTPSSDDPQTECN